MIEKSSVEVKNKITKLVETSQSLLKFITLYFTSTPDMVSCL